MNKYKVMFLPDQKEAVESRDELLAKWHRLHPGETPALT